MCIRDRQYPVARGGEGDIPNHFGDTSKIEPFTPQERASFKPFMSGASSYVYVAAERINTESAAQRRERRRRRTEADRDAREQRRRLSEQAVHMPETVVS